jgi:hypothetical protein
MRGETPGSGLNRLADAALEELFHRLQVAVESQVVV